MKLEDIKIRGSITIDGPAASGKSTLGYMLANALGFLFFDTGAMYRAVTYAALEQGLNLKNETDITRLAEKIKINIQKPSVEDGRMMDIFIDGKDVTWQIRQPDVEAAVSQVSAYKGVRSALTEQQRQIGTQGSIVMVGRDIGTVVMPDAEKKFFLEASADERARRRFEENKSRGKYEDFDQILSAMKERDRIDSSRAIAPLKPATDAIHINTDNKNQTEVLEIMLGYLNS